MNNLNKYREQLVFVLGQIKAIATVVRSTMKRLFTIIGRTVGCKTEGISFDVAVSKWGRAIATFFAINNQTSAQKAKQQLGWKPKPTLSLLEDIEMNHSRGCLSYKCTNFSN